MTEQRPDQDNEDQDGADQGGADQPRAEQDGADQGELENLEYPALRERAFKLAEKRHDIGFFVDLFNHTRAMHAAATEGGSLGDLSGSLIDVVDATRETFGDEPDPELEPLLRARFVTYLRKHGEE